MNNKTRPQQQFNLARLSLTKQARMRVMLTVAICMAFNHAQALPVGEQVQAGNASFARDAQSLNINQTSQQAIVNWQSFGIAANEAVRLYQPNQGVALFRVVGSDPSQIFGSLSATGSLFLTNPNGVLFAPGAQVSVGSLLATTMQISDQDFLAKHYQFSGDSNAAVINQGVIRAEDGGYIVLLGQTVENSGTLQANNGSVVLGSAQSALLDVYGDGLVRVKLSGDALNAAIKNTGNITADGGAVQLAASARTAAVNVAGVVQANTLVNRNGVIHLESGATGTILVSGKVNAKGNATGETGGTVQITGDHVGLLNGAVVNVSGNAGGGTALIGGDYQGKNAQVQNASRTHVAEGASVKADALDSGNGGKVIVWADDITRYYGSISAKGGAIGGNGGFAEVSGKRLLNFLGKADLSAANGVGGNLLLDPLNITISTGADTNTAGFTPPGDITEAFADDVGLNSIFRVNAGGSFAGITPGSTITLQATNNITVSNAFNLATATGTANNSLVLEANNNITVNAGATVTVSGTGSVTMRADADNSGAGAVALNAGIVTAGGAVTLSGATMSSNAAGTINSAGGAVNLSTSTGTSTLSGVISGAGTSINKNGAGTLNLTGANTYTGATNINAGTLLDSASIPNTSVVNVAAGATLDLNNQSEIVGSIVGAGNIIMGTGNLTSGGNNLSTTFSGVISGTGGNFNKAGTGALTLSGNNTYTGLTVVQTGTIVAASNNALGTVAAGTSVATGATLALQGDISVGAEALSINGTGLGANGALRNLSGNNSFAGTVTLAGNTEIQSDAGTLTLSAANSVTGATRTLTVDGAGNTTINGTITTTTGGLTKNNTGVLTLSGANTYTGTTTINAGTLRYGANNAIATGAVTVNNGGIYDLNGFSDTIGALAVNSGATGGSVTTGTGTLTLGGNVTSIGGAGNAIISGNLNLGAATRTVTTTNAADGLTISAVVSGGVGLTKAGNGAVTLAGANTYTGATAVNTGTLVAAHANALGGTATGTTVATGATLNINNVTLANESITINGTGVGGAGALTGTGAAAVGGNVTTASNSSIGATSAASSLTINGMVTAANNLGIVGTGDVTATNASNNFTTVNINGAKNVSLRDVNTITVGNGVSNLTGNLTVRAGGNVTVANNIATTGGDITLAGINFINTAGSSALSASGRWLVYANTHTGNTFGGLNSANQAVWGTVFPAAVSQTGNRYVFANSPALTVTSSNQSKTYGQDVAPIVANAYTASGFINAATFGNVFTQDAAANSLSGSATSTGSPATANVGNYAISVAPITATTGYTLTKNSTGLLTVNPAALTLTASNQTKTYGQTFNFTGTEFTSSGLQNGEIIGSATLT
ncbi:MAG: autotransporter-associated beta strand repeat-containing protein, partial [Methylotenera sp.]